MNIFKDLFDRLTAPMPARKPAPVPSSNQTRQFHADERVLIDKITGSTSTARLKECSNYYSGYVREAVVKRCVVLARSELVAVVAERLNDWVPQVREAARAGLLAMLEEVSVDSLLAILPDVLRTKDTGRGHYAAWVDNFERKLIERVTLVEWTRGLQGPIKVARACAYVFDKYNLLDTASLAALLIERRDNIILANMAADVCAKLEPAYQLPHLRVLARSHFGSVRTRAIAALLEMESEPREAIAIDALHDVQSSVRYLGKIYLSKCGVDVREHYRGLLQGPQHLARSTCTYLISLAGFRNGDDLELIKSFLASERSRVRLTALTAWYKIAENEKDCIAEVALSDPIPRVRKFALALVSRNGAYIPFPVVQARLGALGDWNLILRFAEKNQWNWLECIGRQSVQTGLPEAIEAGLDRSLRDWTRRCSGWYERPGKEQISYLSSAPVLSMLRQLLKGDDEAMALLLQELERHTPSP
jgi:hypothetical protein